MASPWSNLGADLGPVSLCQVNLGVTMEQCGLLVTAASYYREAVVVCEENARAIKLLGSCLLGLGDTRDAVVLLKRAVQVNPRFADAYCDLGSALQASRLATLSNPNPNPLTAT
jgi:tetratricopeptide (TPR) repeat protein